MNIFFNSIKSGYCKIWVKKYFSITTLILFLALQICSAKSIQLIYDENIVDQALIQNIKGSHYITIKDAAILFKGKTQWYPIAGKVILRLKNQAIAFTSQSKTATINKKNVTMSQPAKLINNSLWIPIDFLTSAPFMEIANCTVEFNAENHSLEAGIKSTLSPPRLYSKKNKTQIILESKKELTVNNSQKGPILSFEIPKSRITKEDTLNVKDPLVEKFGIYIDRKGTLLQISLKESVTHYAWSIEKNPPRLIINIFNSKETKDNDLNENQESKTPETNTAPPTSISSTAPISLEIKPEPIEEIQKSNNLTPSSLPTLKIKNTTVKKIVVDAGHGAKDPGAFGKRGTKEKEINLLIALELARALRIEGYEVVLTRTDDTFIPLHDRSDFANNEKADLFISIHCNASMHRKKQGFEVYYLADDASDPHGEETEELENSVIELETKKSEEQIKLQDLLFSMAKNEFLNESSLLCHAISKEVGKKTKNQNRAVMQANFHVLHGVQMPSILIENGYITHSEEEKKLRDKKFRSTMVEAFVAGIQNYEKQIELLKK